MTSRQMLLCMQFTSGYGAAPGAWRLPGVKLSSYTDMDQFVRCAQAAERGKIQMLFFADTPVLDVDLEHQAPRPPDRPTAGHLSANTEREAVLGAEGITAQ
ncbi:hypothetical protein B7755_033765 [Streptomyces sp. NBS 14/10]|uniref:hypothetical protein n=1 Tax=Streptomyces sp. NBS 14/10 TaxID=1945643 RepID=UPI00117E0C5A|nr:hypothetical protein [Streptomyces sp. NBS 14/10]KAK1182666.1 hypothetical protein B7755_033765 [Streptomyces sp. NBS 14/10]